MALTDKRRRFAEEYLIDYNATQAAIRAGYATKGAHNEGHRLLRDVEVAAHIAKLGQPTADELGMTRGYALTRLKEIIDKAIEGAPAMYKGQQVYDDDGNPIYDVAFGAAKSAVELLMRIRGELVDTVEHTGGIDIRVDGVPVDDLS